MGLKMGLKMSVRKLVAHQPPQCIQNRRCDCIVAYVRSDRSSAEPMSVAQGQADCVTSTADGSIEHCTGLYGHVTRSEESECVTVGCIHATRQSDNFRHIRVWHRRTSLSHHSLGQNLKPDTP